MLSEESLELIVQDHLAELEWVSGHGPDFAPGSGERDTWNDIVPVSYTHLTLPTKA